MRLCLGESVDSGLCCGGRFCDWGCDCTDDEDEWAVCGIFGPLGFVMGAGGGRCEGGRFGEILTVELGSVGASGVMGRASEKGRKGGKSSSSSSASDRGLRGALEEYRGRRAKARLRDIGWGASSDEEEEDESLAMADGLASLPRGRCCCFGDASTDLPEVSRLRARWAKEERLSVGVRGDAGICVTVWVEAVRDIGSRNAMSHDSAGMIEETNGVLVVEIPYLFHHEMLCALSLYVTVKTVLAILMPLSNSDAANRVVRTRTAPSGHRVPSRRTAPRYRSRRWRRTRREPIRFLQPSPDL